MCFTIIFVTDYILCSNMDILQETKTGGEKKTFIGHVFSSKEEDKAEIFNVLQYALYALIPIVVLNKLIQRFIPEADTDKSSLEILLEIFIQIIVIFCGIIVIHRIITFFPTYSGFKYDNLTLTNAILAFMMIVLSIQSKLGTKANILVDRVTDLWEGNNSNEKSTKKLRRVNSQVSSHTPSRADFLDNGMMQTDIFPPGPAVQPTSRSDNYMTNSGGGGGVVEQDYLPAGPVAANALIGSTF
jgi:hypothetical protein